MDEKRKNGRIQTIKWREKLAIPEWSGAGIQAGKGRTINRPRGLADRASI